MMLEVGNIVFSSMVATIGTSIFLGVIFSATAPLSAVVITGVALSWAIYKVSDWIYDEIMEEVYE